MADYSEEEEDVQWGQTERPDDQQSEDSGDDDVSADVSVGAMAIEKSDALCVHRAVWSGHLPTLLSALGTAERERERGR
jgi:hypothetical protein